MDLLTEFHMKVKQEQREDRDLNFVEEYSDGIHKYLKSQESLYLAKPGYMKKQKEITEKMRAILVDWLVEVHLKFKLMPETLYLTINIIDRYLEKESVQRSKL